LVSKQDKKDACNGEVRPFVAGFSNFPVLSPGCVSAAFPCRTQVPRVTILAGAARAADGPRKGFNPPHLFLLNLLFLALAADKGAA